MFFQINRFHLFVLITWQFAIFFASQMLFGIFANYRPAWRCGDVGEASHNCSVLESCPREKWQFPDSPFRSAAVEFDWLCGKYAYVGPQFTAILFVGVLLGTFSFGTVSDLIGRKPVAIAALSLGIASNYATGLAPSWQVLLAIRFFLGLAIGGTLVVVCTFVMEMLLPQQRMALRAFFNWGVARLLVTGICWLFPEWRQASIACATTALPALLIIIFIFPESPTWLHNKGRLEEMVASEKRIARFAGVEYVPVEHAKIEHSKSIFELLRQKAMLKRLGVLWMMWFTASVCGYATDLNSSTLSSDLFFGQVLYSVLIAVSKMVLVTFDTFFPRFSRRMLHQGAQAIVILCFLLLTLVTIEGWKGNFVLIVNVIGTVFIEYTWDACYLCAVESMETSCRASATGSCSLVARIGGMIAPTLAFLNTHWAPAVYVTVVILGTLNLLTSFFFLVETKNVVLDKVHIPENSEEDILVPPEEGVPMLDKPLEKVTTAN